jgi:peptide chain release factor 2
VRPTDLRTGIVAQSQNERSQTQNKEMAIKVLGSRLPSALEEPRRRSARQGEHVEAGWATRSELRSPPLPDGQGPAHQPHETGNTGAVLDGDLDAFMQAELIGERKQSPRIYGRGPRQSTSG